LDTNGDWATALGATGVAEGTNDAVVDGASDAIDEGVGVPMRPLGAAAAGLHAATRSETRSSENALGRTGHLARSRPLLGGSIAGEMLRTRLRLGFPSDTRASVGPNGPEVFVSNSAHS
jgi:hypothetical protein